MRVKACIFDFDGTLADSMWVWEEVVRRFLVEHGLPFGVDALSRLAVHGLRKGAEDFVSQYRLDENPDKVLRSWLKYANRMYAERVDLKPGAFEFLLALRSQGIGIAIATAQEHGPLEEALLRNGVMDLFDELVVSSDVCETGKTTPAVYLEAANRLGVISSDCLVFEDVAAAAKVAKDAGFAVAGIADKGPQQNRAALEKVVDFFIESFEGLGVDSLRQSGICLIGRVEGEPR